MKTYKFNSNLSKQTQFSKNNINELREGITKRLLEKYKPKGNYNIKVMSEKQDLKRVA